MFHIARDFVHGSWKQHVSNEKDQVSHCDYPSNLGAYKFIPYRELENQSPALNKDFKVLNTSSWSYAGPSLCPFKERLPPSLAKWASITFSDPSLLTQRLTTLLSFVQTFLSSNGINHYWLTIRATKPTHEYDTPRWHVDDDFFATQLPGVGIARLRSPSTISETSRLRSRSTHRCPSPRRYKLCTTLLGPSTLFLLSNTSALSILQTARYALRDCHEHNCSSLRCLGCATYAEDIRSALANQLGSFPVVSSRPNEMAFFRIGNEEGAVHSEPKCDVDRVFVNMIPGTEEELRRLTGRWGMEFPRAWCLGGEWVQGDEKDDLQQPQLK